MTLEGYIYNEPVIVTVLGQEMTLQEKNSWKALKAGESFTENMNLSNRVGSI